MIKPNEEYYQIAYKYFKHFGHGIELRKIPVDETLEKLIANIKKCLETGVDDLSLKYPALAIPVDGDILT